MDQAGREVMEIVTNESLEMDRKGRDAGKLSRIPFYFEPDYKRPLFEIPPETRKRMFSRLRFLYGEEAAKANMPELERILRVHYAHKPEEMIEAEKSFEPLDRFTEKDMVLITYGDLVHGEEHSPLLPLFLRPGVFGC